MDEILARVEMVAKGYPVRVPNDIWGEVEYRFVLPDGASDGDLEKARRAVGVALPWSQAGRRFSSRKNASGGTSSCVRPSATFWRCS
jgi:hypothetical protein